jgi:hypothetical protein
MVLFGWLLYGALFMTAIAALFPLVKIDGLTGAFVMILFVFLGALELLAGTFSKKTH